MKCIWLIRDEGSHWSSIVRLFEEVNAEIVSLDEDTGLHLARGAVPDLIVLGAASLSRLPPALRKRPRVVFVLGDQRTGEFSAQLGELNQQVLSWPGDRKKLLETASVILGISPRKKFRTLIRIFVGGDPQGFVGKSIDFSLTGMAFSTMMDIAKGSHVGISLSLPGDRGSIRFQLKIVRSAPEEQGDTRGYGGEYLNMQRETLERLTSFVFGR